MRNTYLQNHVEVYDSATVSKLVGKDYISFRPEGTRRLSGTGRTAKLESLAAFHQNTSNPREKTCLLQAT